MVLETRASDSKEPSMRSSRRKRSWEGSPSVEEHEARNLVTFEVRTTPSSRLSTRVIDPGRTLFINLCFISQVSNAFGGVNVSCENGEGKGRKKSRGFLKSGTHKSHTGEWRETGREDEGADEKDVLTGTTHNHPSGLRKTTSVLDLLPWS